VQANVLLVRLLRCIDLGGLSVEPITRGAQLILSCRPPAAATDLFSLDLRRVTPFLVLLDRKPAA